MLMKQILEVYDLLDRADASGEMAAAYLRGLGARDGEIKVDRLGSEKGSTDMIRIRIPGTEGKSGGGSAPTLGILGRLGGLGARPERIGFVSDGDGALAALSAAAKLLDMREKGDRLAGDVVVCTHICPNAPTSPHKPVPFMGSPLDMATVNRHEVDGEMDAILSIDTTKGNRVINTRGFAISPTVKEGYILRISEDLLDLMEATTGKMPYVFPLTIQDITPYGNGLYHLNSILQPSTASSAPVVGVAITTETMVAGCATGATHVTDVEEAARFAIEVAKSYGRGECRFYDGDEFAHIQAMYGDLRRFQTKPDTQGE